jgi:aldehyde:ferredoxin oxidoreductase
MHRNGSRKLPNHNTETLKLLFPCSYNGKARAGIISEHNERVADSLGICTWPYTLFIFHDVERAAKFFHLVTGKDWSVDHLLGIGERIRNLERMFDVRQGLKREDDTLPKQVL